MTPPAASDPGTDRRTVGDILLARGYISEAQLEHAVASQQASGKPLGQVLVEAGAITRLELASALAEQWSDTATWLGPPETARTRGGGRSRAKIDDALAAEGREAGYTQQLQEAVVELARRVASFEPVLTDLRLRVEAGEPEASQHVLDRVEVLQEGVTVLSRRLDEVTDGIERALASIEQSSGELAGELDALGARVDAAAGIGAVDEVRAAVDALAERPTGDPELANIVAALSARVDELAGAVADRSARSELTDAIAAVTGRLDELERASQTRADAAELESMRASVEGLEQQLASRAEAAALDELRGTTAALQAALDDLATRPQADPGLATQLEELTSRIEALAGTDALAAVQAAVEEIAGRPAGDPELSARLDELSARLDDALSALDGRATAEAVDSLRQSMDDVAGRLGSFASADELASLRGAIEELSSRSGETPQLLEELAGLASRIEALAAGGGSGVADAELERRLDHVVSRLDALHARIEEVASAEAPAPDTARIDELRAAIEELSSGRTELAATVDAIAARVEELATPATGTEQPSAVQDELAALRAQVAEVMGVSAKVDEVAARLESMEDASRATAGGEPASDSRLVEVRAKLEARIDELAAELAEARRQAAAAAVAQPAAPSKAKATATDGEPAGVEGELERLRMAVERINMHLGERERAIAELMRNRAHEVKLEELVARLDELEQAAGTPAGVAAGATGGGAELHGELRGLAQRVEEAEKAAKADREKVLAQLERMASSIDWRFRRLEGGEEHAA